MIKRRVVVQRCPAVPTAPKTIAGIALVISASGVTMIALFPPNSNKPRPKRSANLIPTSFPIRVEPVADTRGMRLSVEMYSPIPFPLIKQEIPSGKLFSLATSAQIFCDAIEHKGVFGEDFQIHTSPHTQAKAVFQLHTATGKLKEEIIPTIPSG